MSHFQFHVTPTLPQARIIIHQTDRMSNITAINVQCTQNMSDLSVINNLDNLFKSKNAKSYWCLQENISNFTETSHIFHRLYSDVPRSLCVQYFTCKIHANIL